MKFSSSIRIYIPLAALASMHVLASGCGDNMPAAVSGTDAAPLPDAGVPDGPPPPPPPPTYVSLYPVDPRVHVENPANDPLNPGSFTPDISNDTAHARYAINGMRSGAQPLPGDETILRAALAELAQGSGLSPLEVLDYYALSATADELAAFEAESEAHARGATSGNLATAGRRLVLARKQVRACIIDHAGDPTAQDRCCHGLAFPTFLMAEWSRLTQADRDILIAAAAEDGFYASFSQPADGATPPGFRLQGIKAWLGACDATLARAPATLEAFKAAYGDFRDGTWAVELHPISMAKFAGRRIYRKGGISIAESLADDCSVRETEVIMPRADGELQFLSYELGGNSAVYGYFPGAQPNVDIVKYTPDSCMSCHYTFDARRFGVRFPSYQSLNLTLRYDRNGVPLWSDHSACEQPGDHVVLHAEPPPPPSPM